MMKHIVWMIVILFAVSLEAGFFDRDSKITVQKPPAMEISYEKSEALSLLNDIRESIGMNTLIYNEHLSKAAQAHADYLVQNRVGTHRERSGLPGFLGAKPSDRAVHAGYLSSQVSENLSTKNTDARSSIDGLFSAIYHRLGFLDASIDEIGIGVAQDPNDTHNSAFVYLMGNSSLNALCNERGFHGYGRYIYGFCKEREHKVSQKRFLGAKNTNKRYNPKIIFYPYDGQEDIPPAFYEEDPDPLPDYEVSGFPVSVQFNDLFFDHITLVSFKLFGPGETEIKPVRIFRKKNDPNRRLSAYAFALLPLKRLEYDTDYHAEFVYTEKGRTVSKQWRFHTRRFTAPLLRLEHTQEQIEIEPHKSYILYFVPKNGHDILSDITFPKDLDVAFVDNNTLRIRLISDDTDTFKIKSKKRIVRVKVKQVR